MAVLPNKSPGDYSATGTYTAANFNSQINPLYTWGQATVDGHIAATAAHGVTDIVGEADAASLSNKTLVAAILKSNQLVTETNSRVLTFPTGANDTIVGLTSTDTLTNKTLTSPVLNTPDINSPDIDGGTAGNVTLGGCPFFQEVMAASATTGVNVNSVMVTVAGIAVALKTTECVNGNRITVTDASAGAGSSNISIVGEGGELLSGSATVYIVEDSGSMTFEAYDSNWYIK